MTKRGRAVAAPALLAAAVLSTAAAAHGAGCDTPFEAALRLNGTPYHMTLVTTEPGGRPETSEIISTEDATYVRSRGSWQPGPKEALTLWDSDAGIEDGMTCQLLRSEPSGGTTTDVWRIEDVSDPDEPRHQTVWIATDTGLITRLEIDIDAPGRSDGTRVTAEIDYKDVLAPR